MKRTSHVTVVVKRKSLRRRETEWVKKVNPHGLRVGIVKDWDAKWYADKDFAANLHEDVKNFVTS